MRALAALLLLACSAPSEPASVVVIEAACPTPTDAAVEAGEPAPTGELGDTCADVDDCAELEATAEQAGLPSERVACVPDALGERRCALWCREPGYWDDATAQACAALGGECSPVWCWP